MHWNALGSTLGLGRLVHFEKCLRIGWCSRGLGEGRVGGLALPKTAEPVRQRNNV